MAPGAKSNPGMPAAYAQSGPGQHAAMQPHGQHGYGMQGPGGMPGYGPNANTAQQPHPGFMPGGPGQPGGAPPWMMQPTSGGPSRAVKFTPQVILLVAVGAVCLAIFIIGIVLFVTTKFS